MCSTPFWGDVGIKKWSRFFCFGTRSAIFWHVKTGTFAKSARFHVPKNGTSEAKTKKWRPLFVANYPPKWCTACLFSAFITFGWVLSQLSHEYSKIHSSQDFHTNIFESSLVSIFRFRRCFYLISMDITLRLGIFF